MNISEHIKNFIQEMNRRNYSKNTIDNYVSCLNVFFSTVKKDHPKNINESDIKEFLSSCIKVNTQRNYQGAIKKFYEICLNQKHKFKNIPYARVEKKLPIVLSKDEVQRMFDVCDNLKHKMILSILYACGLRVSELINLKWYNIDRSRMIINIIKGKGNKDRQVMLPEVLIPLLEKYYREYKSKEYVFNGQNSLQYSDRSVLQVVKNLAGKAGISKKVCTHLMRHNCFTHLCEAGTDISIIQKLAGHQNVKTTMIYVHISDSLISKINSPVNSINL
ncbi:MAG: tyrosine-type recombinase/integrase [Saprospiraceae bacterium]